MRRKDSVTLTKIREFDSFLDSVVSGEKDIQGGLLPLQDRAVYLMTMLPLFKYLKIMNKPEFEPCRRVIKLMIEQTPALIYQADAIILQRVILRYNMYIDALNDQLMYN